MEILINKDPVDALSMIVHRSKAYEWGRRVCQKLKDLELLEDKQANFTLADGEKRSLRGFMTINRDKLIALPGEKLQRRIFAVTGNTTLLKAPLIRQT